MSTPPVLPRWKEDYADTKKSVGPQPAVAGGRRWPRVGRRAALLLAAVAAAAAFFFLTEWGAAEDDTDDVDAEYIAKDTLRKADKGDDERGARDGIILSPKPGKGDALRKEWEARRKKDRSELKNAEKERKGKKPGAYGGGDGGKADGSEHAGGAEEAGGADAEGKGPPKIKMAEPIFEGLPNAQDIVDRLSGAAVSKQQPHFAPPGPRPAPGRTEPRAGGPPYPTSEFPELAGPTGCHTPLCDPANLTYARTMIKHAWGSYMRYAKGADDLYPMQKGPRNWYSRNYPLLNTPIDSLDTLWLAGLKAEYEEARKLVDTFDPNAPVLVSFFETTIRQLGGLLSAYALTSDPGLLSKARDLADRLSGAFTESGAGLPMGQVNLRDGSAAPLGWMGGGLGLAEVGTFQLEFTYLARAVGGKEGRKYSARVEGANSQLMQLRKQLKVKGLYPFKIMPGISAAMGMSPSWVYEQNYKIGGGVDSFYEYLLKQWLLSGKDASESHLREAWDEAAVSIVAHLGRNVTKDGRVLTYFPDGPAGGGGSSLEHLACFMGGTLALGARTWEGKDAKGKAEQEKLFRWGEGFTKTCRDSYADQPTGIGPEVIDFSGPHLRPFPSSYARQYLLRPETVESIFYMWRLTHEQRYRDWAWQIMRAIQTWCATPDGYAGLSDVSTDGGIRIGTKERAKLEDPGEMDFSDAGLPHVDLQESFFIAETMKYLLLTFADDDLLPLDEWVFNTEAHPLPVARKGKHGKKAKKKKRKAENGSEAKAEAKAE